MTTKTIRLIIVSVGVFISISVSAHAVRDQLIYPLPGTETEDVVIQWLQRTGYHLRRSKIESNGVRLYAQSGPRYWQIIIRPYSPLATRIKASYTFNGKADPSQVQHLWTLLDDHIKSIMYHAPENQSDMPLIIKSKTKSVVCIYSGRKEKPLKISGFIVDEKGLIISTAHGLSDLKQPITVVLHDGRELPGKVIKLDKRLDLSLVDVRTELDAPIMLSNGRDLTGAAEPLFNVVCTTSPDYAIHPGKINGPPRKLNEQLLWEVKMPIRPGSSGSPVFDLQGNLVAVVKGRYRGAEMVGFLISYGSLIQFLTDSQQ